MDKAYYHLRKNFPEYKRKKLSALALLKRSAANVDRPYISLSFGKDSNVALALALNVFNNLTAIYVNCGEFDEWPDTPRVKREMQQQFRFDLIEVQAESVIECFRRVGHYYVSAQSKEEKTSDRQYSQSFKEAIRSVIHGFDGNIMGLRAEESAARRALLLRFRGPLYYRKEDRQHVCCPLYDWTTDDIWTYHCEYDLPYNAIYDYQHPDGSRPRNGAMFGGTGLLSLRVVYALYPEIFYRFANEFPDVLRYR